MKLIDRYSYQVLEVRMQVRLRKTDKWHTVETLHGKPITLSELGKQYEDFNHFWYITSAGLITSKCVSDISDDKLKLYKKCGNHFESREEAEKAREKIKKALGVNHEDKA